MKLERNGDFCEVVWLWQVGFVVYFFGVVVGS